MVFHTHNFVKLSFFDPDPLSLSMLLKHYVQKVSYYSHNTSPGLFCPSSFDTSLHAFRLVTSPGFPFGFSPHTQLLVESRLWWEHCHKCAGTPRTWYNILDGGWKKSRTILDG